MFFCSLEHVRRTAVLLLLVVVFYVLVVHLWPLAAKLAVELEHGTTWLLTGFRVFPPRRPTGQLTVQFTGLMARQPHKL